VAGTIGERARLEVGALRVLTTPILRDGAAGVGFEPTNEHSPVAGFQDRCVQPLRHPARQSPIVVPERRSRRRRRASTRGVGQPAGQSRSIPGEQAAEEGLAAVQAEARGVARDAEGAAGAGCCASETGGGVFDSRPGAPDGRGSGSERVCRYEWQGRATWVRTEAHESESMKQLIADWVSA
jgi:hypothetical protein